MLWKKHINWCNSYCCYPIMTNVVCFLKGISLYLYGAFDMIRRLFVLILLVVLITTNCLAQKPKVAFVLSGGGAKGFAHVGALKVLEEAGIKPDIITGTSMGSVIGSMYAVGYRTDSLQKIISQTDWDDVVYDGVSRTTLNGIERARYDMYFVKLNFEKTKFQSISGMVKGTKVHNLLSSLCLPVSNIRDFNKFPIPFACIGTDIQTGNKVVLDSGYLPDAVRASMAIPTLFTSIELEDKILVDGGLTQNYPLIEAKNMGADIIIGIDVATKSNRAELGSFVNIMMEAIFLHGYQFYEQEKHLLDLNIKPDLTHISPLDFALGDSIMRIGEFAARKQWDEILALSHRINGNSKLDTPIVTNKKWLHKSYKVKNINIVGLKTIPLFQLNHITEEAKGKTMYVEGIEALIEKYRSTDLFKDITFRFDDYNDLGLLNIYVNEKPPGEFDVGLNYNVYHEASLLLGLSYRNLLFKGSILETNIRLSSMPRFDVSYYYQTSFKPLIGIEVSSSNIIQGLYSNSVKQTDVNSVLTTFYIKSKFPLTKNQLLGVGFGSEFASYESDLIFNFDESFKLSNSKRSENFVLFYMADNRDDAYISTKGSMLKTDLYVASNDFDVSKVWINFTLKAENHLPLARFISVSNSFYLGFNAANYQKGNYQFLYSMGGMLDMKFRNYLPFSGVEFAQELSRNVAQYRLRIPVRLAKNNYLSPNLDLAKTAEYFEDMVNLTDFMLGYGLSYEYRSPIGPIVFNYNRSNRNYLNYFYLNIGYWF